MEKLTTQIRKEAALIYAMTEDEDIDALALSIFEKAKQIDARDEKVKPSLKRKSKPKPRTKK